MTGGHGWGLGDRGPLAGRALYWSTIQECVFSGMLNSVEGLFTPEVSDIHLRIEITGDTYSVYLNGGSGGGNGGPHFPPGTYTIEAQLSGLTGQSSCQSSGFAIAIPPN